MQEEISLATIGKVNAVAVFEQGEMNGLLTAIEKEVMSFVPVVDTFQGRKDIAGLAHRVARSKTFLDDLGKDLIDDAKKKVNAVNSERKVMRDRLDELKALARKPLTEWEAEEEKRAEKIEAAIVDLGTYSCDILSCDELKENLIALKAVVIDESFGDRSAEAAQNKDREVRKLEALIEAKIKSEAEQAELETLRKEKEQREEEDRIEKIRLEGEERAKKKSEDKARIERERVERERLDLQQKHDDEIKKQKKEQQNAIDEVKRVAAEKEQARVDQQKAIDDKAEKDRLEEIRLREKAEREEREKIRLEEEKEEKRIANTKHRGRINQNILSALSAIGISKKDSNNIIKEILAGHIPNVTINY